MSNITFIDARSDDDAVEKIVKFIRWAEDYLKSNGIRTDLVEEYIITYEYEREINNINNRYNANQVSYKGRGALSIIKCISNRDVDNPLTSIVIRDSFFTVQDSPFILMDMIVGTHYHNDIPTALKDKNSYSSSSSFDDVIAFYFSQWIPEYLKVERCIELKCNPFIDNEYVRVIYSNFKRAIRKLHLVYQANQDIHSFWVAAIGEIDIFIRFIVSMKIEESEKELDKEVVALLRPLLLKIETVSHDANNFENYIKEFKLPLLDFLNYCNIDIPENRPGYVQIINHPKYLYNGKLYDTENRIVGFVDILGFGEIVDEFEKDESLDTIEKLSRALNFAIEYGFKVFRKDNELFAKTFQYKLFSDCLCVSLPYYDNEDDFSDQFCMIAQVLKFYQLFMNQEGFFVRGSISFGSYYSDENMIFSLGLVKAYKLESREAQFPRIIIDKAILERIGMVMPDSFKIHGISDLIIVNRSNPDDYAFLNPYNLVGGLRESMDALFAEIDKSFGVDDTEPDVFEGLVGDYIKATMKSITNLVDKSYNKNENLRNILYEIDLRIEKYKDNESVAQKYLSLRPVIEFNLGNNNDYELYFKKSLS